MTCKQSPNGAPTLHNTKKNVQDWLSTPYVPTDSIKATGKKRKENIKIRSGKKQPKSRIIGEPSVKLRFD